MLELVFTYGLDCVAFAALVAGGMLVVHRWLGRLDQAARLPRWSWAVMLLMTAAGVGLALRAGEQEQARRRAMLEGIAPTYADELRLAGHARLRLDTPPDDSLYLALIETEKRWLRLNPGINDIYTFRKTADGRLVLLLDSETDYDRDGHYSGERESRTAIGEEYPLDPEIDATFAGRPGFDAAPQSDRWGVWISAYEPLRDSLGRVEAVLGVDYSAADWLSAIIRARVAALGLTGLVITAVLASAARVAITRTELARRAVADAALRESEARFRTLADNARVMIWMASRPGECIYVNRSWLEFRGRTLDEELGTGWAEGIHPDDRERRALELDQSWAARMPYEIEYRLRRRDGVYCPIQEAGAPRITPDGGFAGYVGTCIDVTDQRVAADALRRARDEALDSARLKSEFLANMSHEIRTPMNGVLGMLALLLERDLRTEDREYAELAHQSAEALLRVINDILDLSRIESGRFRIETEPFDLRRTVTEAVDLLALAARGKGLELTLEFDPAVQPRRAGDAGRLRQILTNLVGNAVKFTERGWVRVRVTGAEGSGADVEITVEDTGIGIPAEQRERIFDKFVQADASTTRRFGGTGLGLAISRQLAELMGGSLALRSEVGRGSTFVLRLPLLPAGSLGAETARGEVPPLPPGLRVLLAEDNPVNQRVASALLRRLGCAVVVAENGCEAVGRVREREFDLVLMDCQMPDMDGFEATAEIRRLPGPPARVPVVALTAHAMAGDRERCLAAGMNGYVTKPIAPEELARVLGECLRVSPLRTG